MVETFRQYRRRGLTVNQVQGPQGFAQQEAARAANAMASALDRMASFQFKQEARRAEQKGIEDAATVNRVTIEDVIKSNNQGADPFAEFDDTIYGRAGRKAAEALLLNDIELAATKEMTDLTVRATDEKMNTQAYMDSLDAIVAGYSSTLDAENPLLSAQIKSTLLTKGASLYSSYAIQNAKQAQADLQGRALIGIDEQKKSIFAMAAETSWNDPTVLEAMDKLAIFMKDNGFDESQISKVKLSTRDQSIVEDKIAKFNDLKTLQEKTDFLNDLKDNPIKQLGEEASRALMKNLGAGLTTANSENKSQAKAVKTEINDLIKVFENGGNPEIDFETYKATIESLGPEGVDAAKALNKLERFSVLKDSFDNLSIAEMQTIKNNFQQQVNKAKSPQAQIAANENLKFATNYLDKMQSGLKEDPITWTSNNEGFSSELNIADPESVAERIKLAERIDFHHNLNVDGIDVKYLKNTEVDALVASYNEMKDTEQKLLLIEEIHNAFGMKSRDVFAQINLADGSMAHIAALYSYQTEHGTYVAHSQKSATLALQGQNLIKDGEFTFDKDVSAMRAEENELLTSLAIAGFEKTRGEIIKTARSIYAKLASDRGETDFFNSDLYREAIDMAAGGNGIVKDDNDNVGGLMELNDSYIMVPPSTNFLHLELAINNPSDYLADGTTVEEVFGGKFREMVAEYGGWDLLMVGPGRYALAVNKHFFENDQGLPIILDLTGTPTWSNNRNVSEDTIDRVIP